MDTQFLTLRLTAEDAVLVARLQAQTGLRKSEIVKRALRQMVSPAAMPAAAGLFALGQASFGRDGDATRQSADIKRVVRERLHAKQR